MSDVRHGSRIFHLRMAGAQKIWRDAEYKAASFGVEDRGDFSNIEFFGKGPFENYSDRNSAALVGLYSQRVEDQYPHEMTFNYVLRPVEN